MFLLAIFGLILVLVFMVDRKFLELRKRFNPNFVYRMWYINFTNRQLILLIGGQLGKVLYEKFDRG